MRRSLNQPPGDTTVLLAVTRRTLVDRWRSLLAWSLGLVAIAALQLSVYPSVQKSATGMQQFVEQWPKGLRDAFGLETYTTGAGYLNAELFTFIVPLVLIAVAVSAGAATTAGEEEHGTADLLLALPVRRATVLLARALALLVVLAVLATLLTVTLVIGSRAVELDVDVQHVAAACGTAALLGLLYGGLALAAGALTGRRAAAVGVPVALALAAFLVQALGGLADWLERFQPYSPFHWAFAEQPLANGLDWQGVALLLGLTVAVLLRAALAYGRRDIRTG
ncbi:MAG TPA: ABC transporter permease subunit [Actinomycetales bacterium]|nr:ABC transporter permease subunit [Actinomycetales bacterium]